MIWALFIGLIVGAVAKLLMPGRDPGGFFVTMLIGVAGAMLANWIGLTFGWYVQGEIPGFVASVIGSMILLGIYRVTIGSPRRTA